MAKTLAQCKLEPKINITHLNTLGQNSITDTIAAGVDPFASFLKSLTDGTGAGSANKLYHKTLTLGSGNTDIDLTSLTDEFGGAYAFSLVKWFILRLTTPATGVYVTVGNAASNGFVGWFGASTHTEAVRDYVIKVNQIDGWTVDSSHKTLRINNPGSSLTADLIMVGE